MTGCAILDSATAARQNGKRLPCEVLQAENAELRDERDRMYKANVEKNGEILRLLEETAELRELVTGLYKCWVNEGCEGCPMQDDDGWCVRDIRLRKLGVEVDG